MKKLLIFTLILCAFVLGSINLNAQILPGVVASGYRSSTGSGYTTQYQTVYNAMTTKPTTYADAQNTLVQTLVNDGLWAKADLIYVFAQETNGAGEALINWVNPGTHNATNTNMTFTANQGFTGGSSKYINTNYYVSTDHVNLTQNSATIAAYSRSGITATACLVGCYHTYRLSLYPYYSGYTYVIYMNSTSNSTNDYSYSSTAGLFTAVRQSSSLSYMYKGSTNLGSGTASSGGLPVGYLYVGMEDANAYFGGEISFVFVGAALSSTEVGYLNTAIETYMDTMGKGVQ